MTTKNKPLQPAKGVTKEERQRARIELLQGLYQETMSEELLRILLYGNWGTGKTLVSSTLPRPIFYQMFDPGGHKLGPLMEGADDGSIIIDTRWQERKWKDSGERFNEWNKDFTAMRTEGFFETIGTYVLDSFSSFQRLAIDAIVEGNVKNSIVSKKMPIKIPEIRDYSVNDGAMMYAISDILTLPTNVCIIAHMEKGIDEATGQTVTFPLITGQKLREKIPTLFDEIWVTRTRGTKYQLLLRPDGFYNARSRLDSRFSMPNRLEADAIGGINLTRDLLVPAGLAKPEDIREIYPPK